MWGIVGAGFNKYICPIKKKPEIICIYNGRKPVRIIVGANSIRPFDIAGREKGDLQFTKVFQHLQAYFTAFFEMELSCDYVVFSENAGKSL
ncbi:hypothetical protein AGMMS49938_09790 [Fibrobacterales bacterium]|nr:hypothetical protein AGMMS49938_09790 [Fibrobacterales bacterium]